MPKLPGREPTRKTYEVDELEVASFLMESETRYWRRPCSVAGCEHRMGPDVKQARWVEWQPCRTDTLPAFTYVRTGDTLDPGGLVCPCHAYEILG